MLSIESRQGLAPMSKKIQAIRSELNELNREFTVVSGDIESLSLRLQTIKHTAARLRRKIDRMKKSMLKKK
jgi:uncharacterized coiled-coil DUF342 family protein